METDSGARFMIVEQKGRDIWRGKHRSIYEAELENSAGIGVDRTLLQRAIKYNVRTVIVFIEEHRRIYLAPIERFFEEGLGNTRANWQGRSTRVLGTHHMVRHYLGPNLKTKRKRANA